MRKDQTIQLEVKPYIKAYLLQRFGPIEPISFPAKSDYNIFMIQRLGKVPDMPSKITHNFEYISILLPETGLKDTWINCYLGWHDRRELRKWIERDFVCDYHRFVSIKFHHGWNRTLATNLFIKRYNISKSNVVWDAFYRAYSRLMKKRRLNYSESDY